VLKIPFSLRILRVKIILRKRVIVNTDNFPDLLNHVGSQTIVLSPPRTTRAGGGTMCANAVNFVTERKIRVSTVQIPALFSVSA